jgi:hypothetical protein
MARHEDVTFQFPTKSPPQAGGVEHEPPDAAASPAEPAAPLLLEPPPAFAVPALAETRGATSVDLPPHATDNNPTSELTTVA